MNLIGTDPAGSDVLFSTTEQLVPQDSDTQEDIYDARVQGGFPALAQPAPCGSEACEGTPTQAPPSPSCRRA